MRNWCEWSEGIVRRHERSLEIVQKLLELKLIQKRTDLTITIIYYKICNAVLRAAIKVAFWK